MRPLVLISLACVVACAPAREARTTDTTTAAVVTDSARAVAATARIHTMLRDSGRMLVMVRASRSTPAFCGRVVWQNGANPVEWQHVVLMGDHLFLERSTPRDDFTQALANC